MSLLPLHFRSIAAQIQISDMAAKDIKWEKIIPLLAMHLTQQFLNAIANRVDLNDIIAVWSLLGIDAIVRLENENGESTRVAVALRNQNNKAYSVYRIAQQPAMVKIRHLLNIDCYWVFCVEERIFPTKEQWIDLLYTQIDSTSRNSCKLINL